MSGHGHVTPNEDGSRARCGGPGICAKCALELQHKNTDAQIAALSPMQQRIQREASDVYRAAVVAHREAKAKYHEAEKLYESAEEAVSAASAELSRTFKALNDARLDYEESLK